jgi:hypothetical protein
MKATATEWFDALSEIKELSGRAKAKFREAGEAKTPTEVAGALAGVMVAVNSIDELLKDILGDIELFLGSK